MPFAAWSQPKVAMLISGHANQSENNLSYDLEELAQSYMVLTNNGIAVDIISPNGGAVLIHDKKDNLQYIQAFKELAINSLKQTISAKQALENDYQAIMIIGGDGAVFDLPVHQNTQKLIKHFVDKEMPIAAVCHGPAALVNIKLEDGSYFVAGKRITSFTSIEDHAFKKEHINKYPFIVQTELEARDARFVNNRPMLPFVAVDGNLITAQNPMSVAKATEALVLKLNITPKERALFKDEATFQLIDNARSQGAGLMDIALSRVKQNYDLNYLALYGIYAYKLAENKENKLIELRVMEQIGKHFSHPKYSLVLIEAYLEQGFINKAKAEKEFLLASNPNFKISVKIQNL